METNVFQKRDAADAMKTMSNPGVDLEDGRFFDSRSVSHEPEEVQKELKEIVH